MNHYRKMASEKSNEFIQENGNKTGSYFSLGIRGGTEEILLDKNNENNEIDECKGDRIIRRSEGILLDRNYEKEEKKKR